MHLPGAEGAVPTAGGIPTQQHLAAGQQLHGDIRWSASQGLGQKPSQIAIISYI